MMREKACSDSSSVSIYCNNQNIITTITAPPNIDDNFLSHQSNCAHLDYVNENGCWADANCFESELVFLSEDIKNLQTHLCISFREAMGVSARSADRTAEKIQILSIQWFTFIGVDQSVKQPKKCISLAVWRSSGRDQSTEAVSVSTFGNAPSVRRRVHFCGDPQTSPDCFTESKFWQFDC
jgi:hypothetical protein